MMPEELHDVAVGELTTAVREFGDQIRPLTAQVVGLTGGMGALNKSIKRHRRYFFVTGAVFLIDLALTVAVILLAIGQHTTDNDVLCPLYVFLISREAIVQNAPNLTEEQRAANAEMFGVIHRGHDKLRCS